MKTITTIKNVMAVMLTTTLSGIAVNAQADTVLGIYADANYWSYNGSLDVSQDNNDVNYDFGNNSTAAIGVALEHMVPFLPNVSVRHAGLDVEKTNNVTNFKVDGKTYNGDTTLALDLTHTDVFAYYEILDNVVSLDVGIGAKILQGDAKVTSKDLSLKSSEDLSVTVPMLYASAGGNLPLTGLSAKANVAGLAIQGNRIIDAQAEVKYNIIDLPLFDLGAKAGYRLLDVKIEDVLKTDFSGNFKGPYVGVEAHF